MASSGDDVLYFTTDARTTMPTFGASSVVNAAFAESARTSFGPADISVSVSGDRRRRGEEDDEMPHIRAPVASNPNDDADSLPGAFPKSLVFPQLHRHGSGLEMPPSPSSSSSSRPPAAAAAAFAVEFNPGRRGDVSKNGFVVRVVDLPRGLGRPDVLIPGRREVLVGSTVGAPRLIAIAASSFDARANVDLIVGDSDSGLAGGGKGPPSGGSVRGIDPGVRLRGACRAWQGAGWDGGLALTTTATTGRSLGSFFFGSGVSSPRAEDAAVSVFRVETTTSNPRRPSREATDDDEARARGARPLSAEAGATRGSIFSNLSLRG